MEDSSWMKWTSRRISLTSAGHVDGFVDLGPFTPAKDKHAVYKHSTVNMFVPFIGKWTQALAAFATCKYEGKPADGSHGWSCRFSKAGLRVDFITSDCAAWDRKMWTKLGVSASSTETKCSVQHPVGTQRQLYFLSNLPHPIKCLRNGLFKSDYQILKGQLG